jgi:MATE family multidrug resistance protein
MDREVRHGRSGHRGIRFNLLIVGDAMLEGLRRWWFRRSGGREVLALSFPLIVSMSSWTVMYFFDRVFLTWLSADAVAAALPAGCLSFAVLCFFLGIASYVNTFVAQYHGAGRPERIGLVVWQGLFIGLAVTPLMIATIPLAPSFFSWAAHTSEVTQLEIVYYQILCWGAGSVVLGAALSAFFTGRGETRTVMVVDILAVGIELVLDYAWIFGHFGLPAAGIEGAAWSTVVAQWFKALVLFWLFLRPANAQRYGGWSGCRFDAALFRRLLQFGSPSGVNLLLEVGAFTALIFLIGRLGARELTATNLAFSVNTLAFLPMLGFGVATTTIVGQRLGENRADLAARATWTAFWLGTAYMTAFGLAYVLIPDWLLAANAAQVDPAAFAPVRDMTVLLLRFVAVYCLFDTMNIVFVSALKGAGDMRFILITTLIMSALPVAATWVGIHWFDWGLVGAWFIITVWVCLLGCTYLSRFVQGKWRAMRVIEPQYLPDLEETQVSAPILSIDVPAA